MQAKPESTLSVNTYIVNSVDCSRYSLVFSIDPGKLWECGFNVDIERQITKSCVLLTRFFFKYLYGKKSYIKYLTRQYLFQINKLALEKEKLRQNFLH